MKMVVIVIINTYTVLLVKITFITVLLVKIMWFCPFYPCDKCLNFYAAMYGELSLCWALEVTSFLLFLRGSWALEGISFLLLFWVLIDCTRVVCDLISNQGFSLTKFILMTLTFSKFCVTRQWLWVYYWFPWLNWY